MKRSYRNKSNKRNGGGPFPLSYYKTDAHEPSASAGRDLLEAMPPIGVRPKIGGKRHRTRKHHTRRHRKTRGGFVPSIMDGFAAAASKYIVPVALFAGYKLMTRKGKRGSHHRRHTRRH